jgi:hypothetical protein
MKCPHCQGENREGVKFCEDCGATIESICPHCIAAVLPGKKFCGDCGKPLTAATPSDAANAKPSATSPATIF